MSRLSQSTNIESGYQQLGIFQFSNGSSSGNYIHMETNITHPSSNIMFMLEAVGYCYGTSNPVRCSWNCYSYAYIISNTNNTNYTGMSANGVYKSSDGYCVIRAYAGSHYYNGFMLNAYATRTDTTHYKLSVTAAVQTDNSGNYY